MSENELSGTDPRLLRLHPRDNVLTAIARFEPGETVRIGGEPVTLPHRLPFGHKIAATPIRIGEKIIKYGVAIGSATCPIARGEHVHTHNVKSDYLPTRYFEAPLNGVEARAEGRVNPQTEQSS